MYLRGPEEATLSSTLVVAARARTLIQNKVEA